MIKTTFEERMMLLEQYGYRYKYLCEENYYVSVLLDDNCAALLELPLEDMPLHINDHTHAGAVAKWRLEIAK